MSAFRYRAGTYPANQMTSAYNVESFPMQSDQRNYPWKIITPSEMARRYDARTGGGLDGTVRFIGSWNLRWYFTAITPLMLDYVLDTMFPTDGVNEVCTIVTYTARDGWICLNATAHFVEPADAGESKPRGLFLHGVYIEFDEGTIAGTGGDFNSDFSSDFYIGGIP